MCPVASGIRACMMRAMRRLALIVLSCFAVTSGRAANSSAAPQPVAPATAVIAPLPKPADLTAALLAEPNRVRRLHGRRALQSRPELDGAADDQAAFMALTFTA